MIKNMKLWKTLLIAISVAILPFALVGVGQAQQLTCWGLRPNLTEHADYSQQHLPQEHEDIPERTSEISHCAEDENDTEKVDFR
jgi:hypothetical protein